jgi:imidazole glycerol-phosphate synthase subunit HisF
MLKIRVIPTLLHKGFGLVKGVRFDSRRAVGSPMQAVKVYNLRNVDELVFLDVTATTEGRGPDLELIDELADECFMPLAVGGGIRSVDDVRALLGVGADKVVIGTAALRTPDVVREAADRFGSQCVVCAIDARREPGGGWRAYVDGGRKPTDWDAVAWAAHAVELGAGEVLMTSMDSDGVQDGYDLELVRILCETVDVPVVASGGAGKPEHLADALEAGAEAALAASIFHDGTHTVEEAKAACRARGLPMR